MVDMKPNTLTLIFGPQDPDIDSGHLDGLRTELLEASHLQWIVDLLTKLPQEWPTISAAHPELQAFQGRKYLQMLSEWMRRGLLPQNQFPLPNVLVTPLVVTTQLAQYTRFLEQIKPNITREDSLKDVLKIETETTGLCTGLLSSAAVASSGSLAELEKHGATAIRMAIAIGALVDAGDSEVEDGDKWQSIAVGWTTQTTEAKLYSIVEHFPEAYISVISEARLATLTVLKVDSSEIQEQLKNAGLIFTKTTLRGPFHCGRREDQATALLGLFDSESAFHFPAQLAFKTRAADGSDLPEDEKLHQMASRAMLTDRADWHKLFTTLHETTSLAVTFGSQRFVPQWFLRKLGPKLSHAVDLDIQAGKCPAPMYALLDSTQDHSIAVVGMACHFPGGSDINEFWKTICAGESQAREVSADRVNFEYAAWRESNPDRKWFGNFVEDHDVFDHKFFQKSPREVVSTDPQHRLMLQVAYQAVQQSGYFNKPSSSRHVGCYVGIGVTDYENNVACYEPTAYTATGNLKSFAAGKISHFFGWSGPGVTIDTACSSSALAVHHACRAILSGECDASLAGGVNLMTSPEWYQNLAGASFLSPSGQCKPFDVAADGYCRGEGAGAVFLKKLSAAVEDGDQILGVIKGSSVNQNENCSAITAPSVLSLGNVFNSVLRKARLDPKQISVVEAHGTGTQVGDKAEYDSVRKTLGGPGRAQPLNLGSVKGLIGHLECGSGIAALIKVLLMIQHGSIPPQAGFNTLNPKLRALPSDNIDISKNLKPWEADFRAALLNNYGASGSNASLIVTQASQVPRDGEPLKTSIGFKRPFWFSGLDNQSLRSYAAKMIEFLQSRKANDYHFSIANLSFQLAHQSNRSLGEALIFSCASADELEAKLAGFANGRGELASTTGKQPSRPVILCFGGQRSNFVGLDREAYEYFPLLRAHLDHCHEVCLSLGLGGIVPAIFERTPRQSIVELQTMQFALQYSCAKSWIESGLQVSALVGHSFGELTAMCVSGMLSVEHALETISRRARIIEEKWGAETGCMLAVDGELENVQQLLQLVNAASSAPVNIACFNGPRNFTLAGTTSAIGLVKKTISTSLTLSNIKTKALDTTHAFHSALVDDLIPELEKLGEDVIFRKPAIQHERATQASASSPPPFTVFASHMRDPVYFDKAVQRLADQYPSSIWLEAGSGSGVTALASRAAGSQNMIFQSINITSSGAVQNITDATVNLWKAGVNMSFWEHVKPAIDCPLLLLPPYQFTKSKHWLERRKQEVKQIDSVVKAPDARTGMWSFIGYDSTNTNARFQVHTESEEFQAYVGAHFIAQTAAICPSMVQQVIARDALASLVDESDLLPGLESMESESPLCLGGSKQVWLDAEMVGDSPLTWKFHITSTDHTGEATQHVSGRMIFRSPEDAAQVFDTYERLVDHKRAVALLDGEDSDQVIKGSRNIYKVFTPVVQYNKDSYKGLQKLASAGNESAGRIIKQDPTQTILSVGLGDTFCQVAGIFLNCMADCTEGNMYLSNRVDRWIRSPSFPVDARPERWDVYARHQQSPKAYVSDLFIFDADSGKLAWVVLGLHFVEVSIAGMSRLLSKLTGAQPAQQTALTQVAVPDVAPIKSSARKDIPVREFKTTKAAASSAASKKQPNAKKDEGPDVLGGVRALFINLLGLEADEVQLNSDLIELGIDSLLAMEVAREVEKKFSIKFELDELMDMTDVRSLVDGIRANMGASDSSETGEDSSDEIVTSSSISDSIMTPGDEIDGIYKSDVQLSASSIVEIFTETKLLTDQFIEKNQLSGYSNYVQPKLTELVIVYTLDALDQMGCSLRSAQPGEMVAQIPHLPKHDKVMAVLRGLLEKARLVDIEGSALIRTALPVPSKSASKLLDELLHEYPEHYYDHKLTSLTGSKLADCLTGKTEGIQLLFGSAEGRELAAGMYGKSPINVAWLRQLEHFWEQLMAQLPTERDEPIRILEMGAGTGGTTAALLPLLARSGVPVEYIASDISPSLVAGLRKRFREYPWMRFEVIDIEKSAPSKLLESQHIILATNCVHATHSLANTTKNIHKMLRPDGFLIMLEMTEAVPWVDSVFGLVEGWWLFDDGRDHALAQPEVWEDTLHRNGYGHIDWTDGHLPENSIQRIIIALASPEVHSRVSIFPPAPSKVPADFSARQTVTDSLVGKHTSGFAAPVPRSTGQISSRCVLVTGATGCLGSHIVAHLVEQQSVRKVICLNRVSSSDPNARQHEALLSRGLVLNDKTSKLDIIETDSSAPNLGLCPEDYQYLVTNATDIVHNAWAMSMTRPVRGFEPQFKAMRNLINLSRDCSSNGRKIGFQFISSVSVVGSHPFLSGLAQVPEERVNIASALPMGYADAKLVCEHMLDETLHRYPEFFRVSSVRVGQISGSKVNGNWNPVEHLVHLIKSSQTLGVLPDLEGVLSWCPVNDVAATLCDLLIEERPAYPIYHIENPVRQPWREMITIISDALNISQTNIIPYGEWLRRVRQFPPSLISENPAARLADFFETDFLRMSCGGMILDTARTREHSETFRGLGPIDEALVRRYIQAWKESGFLHL